MTGAIAGLAGGAFTTLAVEVKSSDRIGLDPSTAPSAESKSMFISPKDFLQFGLFQQLLVDDDIRSAVYRDNACQLLRLT